MVKVVLLHTSGNTCLDFLSILAIVFAVSIYHAPNLLLAELIYPLRHFVRFYNLI